MELNSIQRGATHVCLPLKLSPRCPPAPQQPHNLCSPVATRHTMSATHSGLQATSSHRSATTSAAVAVSSPQGCNRSSWHCHCHHDNTHDHSRHSSRRIKGLSSECFSHRVFGNLVACSRSSAYNHRIRAAAAPEDAQSAAHNDDHSRSGQASTPPSASLALASPQPVQSERIGGDGGQGRDCGNGGGHGSGSGSGDDAGGFAEQPKFPVWYTVWVWCTALLYLVWRWQWRRDRRLAAEQFEQEQAAEEQLKQDWQNFAQQYKTQARPPAATTAGNNGRR